jgi:hypothetical protein
MIDIDPISKPTPSQGETVTSGACAVTTGVRRSCWKVMPIVVSPRAGLRGSRA